MDEVWIFYQQGRLYGLKEATLQLYLISELVCWENNVDYVLEFAKGRFKVHGHNYVF